MNSKSDLSISSREATSNVPAPRFTAEQLQWFKAYERVRKGGRYNMFDPRARHASGLDKEQYRFVMKNFGELKDASAA